MGCIFPGCTRDTNGLDKCFHHRVTTFWQYNKVLMNPQPMLELNQVKANRDGKWCHWEIGWGHEEMIPLLNQPRVKCGVQKDPDAGLWYWLIDS